MSHKEHEGKALCNTRQHSMSLEQKWENVSCKRCLRSKLNFEKIGV